MICPRCNFGNVHVTNELTGGRTSQKDKVVFGGLEEVL
jgi:hypothetical protein